MAKRIITKIGDIFSVTMDNGNMRFFQYIAKDMSCLSSPVIRVFKREYPAEYKLDTDEVVADEIDFYAHTILRWGLEEGYWIKVGKNQDIGEVDNILFRMYHSNAIDHKNRLWYAYYINKERFDIGQLSDFYRDKSDIGLIIPAEAIVNRIKTGVYSGTIFAAWEH